MKLARRRQPFAATLEKAGQLWRFHVDLDDPAHVSQVLDAITACAKDPDHPLDWFDAAVLGHVIRGRVLKLMGARA